MVPARSTFVITAALAAALGCGRGVSRETSAHRTHTKGEIVATVNGVPITAADVRLATRGDVHGAGAVSERAAVEGLVRQELAAQRAAELGLDPGPEYRVERERLEAQLAALERRTLAEAYERHGAAAATRVSEADARGYFDTHAAEIRTELHVAQILVRDEARAAAARRELDAGVPFEQVARAQLPELPDAGLTPWDLGWLRWNQVPEPWRDVVARLAVGETSGVIRGPRSRFWIVKLVERRESPEITFEAVRPAVVEALRAAKLEALHDAGDAELRARARIFYHREPQG